MGKRLSRIVTSLQLATWVSTATEVLPCTHQIRKWWTGRSGMTIRSMDGVKVARNQSLHIIIHQILIGHQSHRETSTKLKLFQASAFMAVTMVRTTLFASTMTLLQVGSLTSILVALLQTLWCAPILFKNGHNSSNRRLPVSKIGLQRQDWHHYHLFPAPHFLALTTVLMTTTSIKATCARRHRQP